MPVVTSLVLAAALAAEPDYAAECEAGQAQSCVLLSILASKSADPASQAEAEAWHGKAVALYDAACARKDRTACEQLADIWLSRGNPAQATKAWERACDLDPVACVTLADKMSERKIPPEIPRALLERSCGHSVGLGCVGAAVLGEETGLAAEVVRTRFDKGISLLTAECEHAKDPERAALACNSLGDVHYYGVFMESPERDKGLTYWSRGCVTGVACRAKATLVLALGDPEGSVTLLRRACELGDCEHWEKTCKELAIEGGPCAPLVQ